MVCCLLLYLCLCRFADTPVDQLKMVGSSSDLCHSPFFVIHLPLKPTLLCFWFTFFCRFADTPVEQLKMETTRPLSFPFLYNRPLSIFFNYSFCRFADTPVEQLKMETIRAIYEWPSFLHEAEPFAGVLAKARAKLLDQFGDLEGAWQDPETRQQFLKLPFR